MKLKHPTQYKIEIPYLASLILNHSLDKPIPALKDFPKEERPPSAIIFWSFRIMVMLGMLMLLQAFVALVLRKGRKLYKSGLFLKFTVAMGPSGLIAILAGWFTTEIGRQPWTVYGLQKTADAVSAHSTLQMSVSLMLFIVIYCAVFGAGYFYMLVQMRQGVVPDAGSEHEVPVISGRL